MLEITQAFAEVDMGDQRANAIQWVTESRIDYVFANETLTPCIEICWVDQCGTFPTHRQLMIEINEKKLCRQMRTLVKPTNFAAMFEDIVQAQVEDARLQMEKANEANPQGEENKSIEENAIRKSILKKLNHLMYQQIQKIFYRIKHAQAMEKTEQQLDMIADAV